MLENLTSDVVHLSGAGHMAATMNTLMICHKSPSGAYTRSPAMGRQLVRKGHQVTLMLISKKERWHIHVFDWEGVKAIETPHLFINRLRYGWDAWNMIRRFIYLSKETQTHNLIHCFETRPLSISEKLAHDILSLPMYAELSEEEIRYVCKKIKTFF